MLPKNEVEKLYSSLILKQITVENAIQPDTLIKVNKSYENKKRQNVPTDQKQVRFGQTVR